MKLAKRVQSLKPSVGFELLKIAKQMKEQGDDVVSLAIGEPQEETYKEIQTAGKKAIEEGHTKYSPSAGTQPLRQKLAKQAESHLGFPIDYENVLVAPGCKYALYTAFQCLCEKGDEVILPSPYWMSYPPLIELAEANLKVVPTQANNNFKLTAKELDQAITPQTKVFLLNSPNNPTGSVYTEDELKALGAVLKKHPKVVIMVDAIYDRLVYKGKYAPHILKVCPDLKDQTLAFNGASKNYLMTGWRLGWLIGPKNLVKSFSAFLSQSAGCTSTISQRAFEQAFLDCEEDIARIIKKFQQARDALTQSLKEVSDLVLCPSEGAFYLWVSVQKSIGKKYQGQTLKSSKDIMEQLLKQKKLLCICGEEFGMAGYLRLSYVANLEDIKKAGQRLKEFFTELT